MKTRATEIVAVTVPVLVEAVAVILFIMAAVLWAGIGGGSI